MRNWANRHIMFRILFVFSTVVFVVGVLAAQTPTNRRAGDLIAFSTVAISSAAALVFFWVKTKEEFVGRLMRLEIWECVLALEFMVAINSIFQIIRHTLWMRF